jgi:DNA ligase-1
MLAHDYTKANNAGKIKFPCLVPPKLDGVRCTSFWRNGKIYLESRGGKEYPAPKHIQDQLALVQGASDRIDGELYVHGEMLQDITGASKKWRKLTDRLEFWVFDVVRPGPYTDRVAWLENWFSSMPAECTHLKLVPNYECANQAELKEIHDRCVQQGYEGVMIRNTDGEYEQRRSYDLQKYKEFLDSEFLIVDIRKDKNDNAVFVLEHPNGQFTTTYGSFDERKHQLANPGEYIGKYLTVQYQSVYKDTLMPQFPTGKGVRAGKMIDGEFHPEV